jgi:ABC-type glutathione transport system ATPase component
MSASLVAVENLSIGRSPSQPIVHDLSFAVRAGEVLGIIGESGSGKTLTAYSIAGLLPAGLKTLSGRIQVEGRVLGELHADERRALAGNRIGMIFQDPLSSFNPVRTIGSLLIESGMRHRGLSRGAARHQAIAALAAVRLPDAATTIDAYPHQLSGGQRQRAMIALARFNDPALLIADEPTTALDATVQLQILALLKGSLASSALILISHDLRVAASMCDRILVMHRGRCVEQGDAQQILQTPQHAYTQRLIAAVETLTEGSVPAREAVEA